MNPLPLASRLARRARYLFARNRAEREMNEEMRTHLEFEIEDRIRQGFTPEEARRTAFVDFGGVERFKEEGRVARGTRVVEDLAQDAQYAVRVLAKSPAFTLAGVLTVAVGIAAMTAVFSVVEAVLLRPPPVTAPRELFMVAEVWKGGDRSFGTSMGQYQYPYAHYADLRDATGTAFSGLAGFRYSGVSVFNGSEARPLSAMIVSANYFDVLGVRPLLGRAFSNATDRAGAPAPEVVISYNLWQRDFARDSAVIGRSLKIDGRQRTIVGVAPRGFDGTVTGLVTDLWAPTNDGAVAMIGRLRSGVSSQRAIAMLTATAQHVPPVSQSRPIVRMTLDPVIGPPAMARGAVIGFMGMLFFTAALVLFIVVSNIAGMFLARAAHRRREIAVRLALGAGRGRLVRQLLTESAMLCLAGGIAGVVLASWLVHLLPSIELPMSARTSLDLHLDRVVLAVSFGATLAAGIAVGLTPALQSTRVDLLTALRGTVTDGLKGLGRARGGFVVAQLTMSLVLLVTAGLFARALQRASLVDRGLDASNVVVAELNLARHGYDQPRARAFYAQLLSRLVARPEVASASLGQYTPLSLAHNGGSVTTPDGHRVPVTWGFADAGYLETMRIPLVTGRSFDASDTPASAPVVVINETLARQLSPGANPLGQLVRLDGVRQIVGIVRDGKYRSLGESPTAYAFIPFTQHYSEQMTVHVRARADNAAALAALRAEVAALDPNVAMENAGSLSTQLDLYLIPQEAAAWCIGAFGILGLGLAAMGIYGVISYDVAQRTRELGIRLALGARRIDVVTAVLRPGLGIIAVAIAIGVPVSMGVGRLARDFLYGVGSVDPVTFAVVPLLLGLVALLAGYIPARRAGRVDPMDSLRAE